MISPVFLPLPGSASLWPRGSAAESLAMRHMPPRKPRSAASYASWRYGGKTEVDRAGCKLAGFEMGAVSSNDRPAERQPMVPNNTVNAWSFRSLVFCFMTGGFHAEVKDFGLENHPGIESIIRTVDHMV
jgi:hypothetical protein